MTAAAVPAYDASPGVPGGVVMPGAVPVKPTLHQMPRYLQLAQTLVAEIEAGRHAVGDLLPTEHELCEQFGASRFTVREALKRLVQMGMVTRQAGVGTRVLGPRQPTGYLQTLEGLADLHRYTGETELTILSRETIEVSGALAEELGAGAGEAWLVLEALRRRAGAALVIAFTRIYIHPAFRGLIGLDGGDNSPIYTRIEQQFGEQIVEVHQQIHGVSIGADVAAKLDVKRGSPGLRVTRAYVNARGETVELAVSLHPADRFSYSQTFHRDDRGKLL
jgi:GntR family transcriptional regulator